MARPRYSTHYTTEQRPEQALKASITQAAEALVEELRQGKSERFEALLAFASRFHQYSVGNQILIAQQCPSATRVAGYRTWEALGYHVAKGQRVHPHPGPPHLHAPRRGDRHRP